VNLKTRILLQTLSASLIFTTLLSLMFFLTIAEIRKTVLANSTELGNRTARVSSYALKEQVIDSITRIASDWSVILDEKLLKIENHTRMTADIAGAIYTRRESYRPHPLRRVLPEETPPSEPYLHIAPGVDFSAIRAETNLAGNIGDVLRQILVVDRGISTSTIGGESGYMIAMDSFPWPLTNFDPRRFPWYTGAKERGGLFWTEVYADLRGRGPAISCAVPFYEDSGRRQIFRGVARSTVLLSDFSKMMDSAKVGRTGYIFLLDGSGMKLFSSGNVAVRSRTDGGVEGENYLESGGGLRSLALSMTLGASGMTVLEIEDRPVYAAYAPIQTLGWSLGVVIPAEEAGVPSWLIEEQIQSLTGETKADMDRQILFFTGFLAFTLFAGLLAIAFFSVKFSSAITGPILALNNGVREISGGNLGREVRISTGDELEQLAASFNAMTGRLRDHIGEIARVTAEKERIATELDVAARIQTSMLPVDFPPFPGRETEFDLYAAVYPAKEVGGDFYDFFFIDDDHFVFLAADVSGKGIPAALFMVISKALIKNHLQSGEVPELAMENINRQLCGNNLADMFVTLWLGILEISSGRLEYINAGHNPPLLRRGNGGFVFLKSPPDLVLAGMEDTLYYRREIFLEKGDMLFLYTDGITEAEDTEENFYGTERLKDFLDRRSGAPLREILDCLRLDIGVFSRGAEQSDDITMLALRVDGSNSAAAAPQDASAPASITLKADTGELEKLIGFIGTGLEKALCPDKIRGQIELAAEEIFVNIAHYAYKTPGPNGPVPCEVLVSCTVEKNASGRRMILGFSDRGEAFNPLEYADPDVNAPLEQRSEGGLGILIVKRTMDTIQYGYDGGTNLLVVTKAWECPPLEEL
jgi:sigma-B regulation protein RsbU (phosphoserine phosphatase)